MMKIEHHLFQSTSRSSETFQADRDGDGSAQLAWVDGLFAAMGCELGVCSTMKH